MADIQLEQLLNSFVEKAMRQKFRLDQSLSNYADLDQTLRDAIIDENTLIQTASDYGLNQTQIENIKQRKTDNENLRDDLMTIIDDLKEKRIQLMDDILDHLLALTDINIEKSGFMTHIITTSYGTKYDSFNKIITFKEKGHAEYPISTSLSSWKDSSQLTINLSEE